MSLGHSEHENWDPAFLKHSRSLALKHCIACMRTSDECSFMSLIPIALMTIMTKLISMIKIRCK